MPALRPILVALITLGVVWGGIVLVGRLLGDDASGDGLEPGTHKTVVVAALGALARGDLPAVRPYMTDEGWRQLQRDIRLFQAELADADKRARQRQLAVESLTDEEWEAAVRQALTGDEADAWRLLSRLYPMDDPPRLAGIRLDPDQPEKTSYLYWGPTKHRRQVDLVRERGTWRIQFISLL